MKYVSIIKKKDINENTQYKPCHWECRDKKLKCMIGTIAWQPIWREYVFYDVYPDYYIYRNRLREIEKFVKKLNKCKEKIFFETYGGKK